ncbi:ASCH domain-containing protein [Pantoea ananatis]|uniref:ASCH domain-containing protein n=1 Tax=Pantoea TaxID=53335 RepID=UPI00197FED0E|nr:MULTISPECIES: ASCH domain-containing protein [Pantoea]MCS4494627.1 ASCH domain-containing protein [Pantoea sp. B623]MDI6539981.1 ASCH domain-containing protein [Pantoea ananatis]
MKALSIVRPAGTQIANGLKTLEIRRWLPEVQAGEEILLVEHEPFLTSDRQEELGTAVAVITFGEIREFRREDIPQACASYYEDGWLAWAFKTIKKIDNPFLIRAARKLYEIDDTVIHSVSLTKIR